MAKAENGKPARSQDARQASAGRWETEVGACRALRIGSHVWVTGASALRADGHVFGRGDAEAQAGRCLDVIEEALARFDAGMGDVVRIQVGLSDVRCWQAAERACAMRFAEHPPAVSFVESDALSHPDMLVEIEAEAFLAPPGAGA